MDREGWNRRYEARELIWSATANRFLVEEAAGLVPGRALDLGAGEGRNAVWLAEQGWEVTAVDFSEVGLAKGGRLAGERGVRARWVAADLREYDPEADAFELVALLYLHLPADDRRHVLAAASAAVAPGGVLLVIGHHTSNIAEGCGRGLSQGQHGYELVGPNEKGLQLFHEAHARETGYAGLRYR